MNWFKYLYLITKLGCVLGGTSVHYNPTCEQIANETAEIPFAECDSIINLAWGPSVKKTTSPSKYCSIMLDGFDTSPQTVKSFTDKHIKTIAYTSVGTKEKWRPDANKFKLNALVSKQNGYGEQWINPQQWKLLKPVMYNRFALFKKKGFYAVEVDNIDLMGNVKEATLTNVYEYAVWLSNTAHSMGLKIVLKNTPYLCSKLVNYYDAVISEQTDEYPSDMKGYKYFIDVDKYWWDFEYRIAKNQKLLKLATHVYRSSNNGWIQQS